MSGVDDLITWLRAQLDEDERVARGAAELPYGSVEWISGAEGSVLGTDEDSELHVRGAILSLDDVGEHIARWDPARVLAEVEARRRVLDEIADEATGLDMSVDMDRRVGPPRNTEVEPYLGDQLVRLLTQPYAGRPGWCEEWRV